MGPDLTNARSIVITLKRADAAMAHGAPNAAWSWTATVDGKHMGGGACPTPDGAVDDAEQALWPDAEAGEPDEGEDGDEQEGGEADTDAGSESSEGGPTASQGSGVPTEQQLWQQEAAKRTKRNAAIRSM